MRESVLGKLLGWFNCMANCVVDPVISLIFRGWAVLDFWRSGTLALENFDTRMMLYEYEYNVPLLNPKIAAYLGTGVEIIFPFLIFIGLATRLSTIPLIFLVLVIEFTYQHSPEHIVWFITLFMIMAKGPGMISVDYLIDRFSKK
jgi:putative oxidoreductase